MFGAADRPPSFSSRAACEAARREAARRSWRHTAAAPKRHEVHRCAVGATIPGFARAHLPATWRSARLWPARLSETVDSTRRPAPRSAARPAPASLHRSARGFSSSWLPTGRTPHAATPEARSRFGRNRRPARGRATTFRASAIAKRLPISRMRALLRRVSPSSDASVRRAHCKAAIRDTLCPASMRTFRVVTAPSLPRSRSVRSAPFAVSIPAMNQSTAVRMPRLDDDFLRAERRNIDQLRAAAEQRIGGLCLRQRRQVDAAPAARLGDGL